MSCKGTFFVPQNNGELAVEATTGTLKRKHNAEKVYSHFFHVLRDSRNELLLGEKVIHGHANRRNTKQLCLVIVRVLFVVQSQRVSHQQGRPEMRIVFGILQSHEQQ